MNLRVLIYLNPSNIDKFTHKFNLDGDSGFNLVKNSILALNKIVDWHFYVLVPPNSCNWENKPKNITLLDYPYINDALNSRFHFDTNAINDLFNVYKHDIDLIWSMLPEHVSALKGFANKRREEIPVFTYINWMDYRENKSYEPSYKLRMLDGIYNADCVGIQSEHMLNTMKEILSGFEIPKDKIQIITPKTSKQNTELSVGNLIGFPHRVSQESGFNVMFELIKDKLKYDLWVSNLNNVSLPNHPKLINKFISNTEEYYKELNKLRFGVSYHVTYSMWSMSVLDMMACGKVVLVPYKNAFPEMFPIGYPFFYESSEEFVKKFEQLQTCDDSILIEWGKKNKEHCEKYFTWETQANELRDSFYSLLTTNKVDKTEEVFEIIKDYNAITKGDLINKNITPFGRRCSRAWNKTRIELMRDFEIKDDTSSEHTLFYFDEKRYKENGIERRPEKIKTPYELKKLAK